MMKRGPLNRNGSRILGMAHGLLGAAVRLAVAAEAAATELPPGTTFLPPSPQRQGEAVRGYEYLVAGDYVSSGVPLAVFREATRRSEHDLGRTGLASGVPYRYNVVRTKDGVEVVAPNCLTCHAEFLNGTLTIGLGNNSDDHTVYNPLAAAAAGLATALKFGADSPEVRAYQPAQRAYQAIGPLITTRVRGVNPADKIFAALAAHRQADDLSWIADRQFEVPVETIPTDVPAWWLLKKKHALYYNGLGRGDFARLSSASGMLTLKNSAEAAQIDTRFPDVIAWIRTLKAPKYPHPVDPTRATRGRSVFENRCAKCHGRYGENESFPNLVVDLDTVGTDPALARSYAERPEYHTWYNHSWYAHGPHAGRLEPTGGYVAPPLDGIWATAPYFHNGSVPTLRDVLDSSRRPAYWRRDFSNSWYDEVNGGWTTESRDRVDPGDRLTYDTTLPGYGNGGHEFGDALAEEARSDLVEYLKTL